MKLGKLYETAVAVGMERDLRGEAEVRSVLEEAKKAYSKIKKDEKEYFDKERLTNPFSDTRILHGDPDTELKIVMVGIDAGEAELLLADRLTEKGRSVDCVISHHPHGNALSLLPDVMKLQAGVMERLGVPIGQAEGVLAPRIKEIADRLHPANAQKAVDVAKLLDIPLICLHTVADNCVADYLTNLLEEAGPRTLDDVIEIVMDIPEFQQGKREEAGPVIAAGKGSSRAGKTFVDMTGGTEGAVEMYLKMARSTGVSTIVGMHLSKEHVEQAKEENLNVIITGHISADNLGVNLLLDRCLEPDVEVIEVGGFRRFQRNAD